MALPSQAQSVDDSKFFVLSVLYDVSRVRSGKSGEGYRGRSNGIFFCGKYLSRSERGVILFVFGNNAALCTGRFDDGAIDDRACEEKEIPLSAAGFDHGSHFRNVCVTICAQSIQHRNYRGGKSAEFVPYDYVHLAIRE